MFKAPFLRWAAVKSADHDVAFALNRLYVPVFSLSRTAALNLPVVPTLNRL